MNFKKELYQIIRISNYLVKIHRMKKKNMVIPKLMRYKVIKKIVIGQVKMKIKKIRKIKKRVKNNKLKEITKIHKITKIRDQMFKVQQLRLIMA